MNLLLVDDDKFERDGLRFLLAKMHYPFHILEARNGAIALEVLQANNIDIVITDIKMPVLNGMEFLKQAKVIKPDTVYLIYSGYDDFLYAKEAIALKVMDFVVKPVSEDDFYRIMKNAIKIIEARRQSAYKEIISHALFDNSIHTDMHIYGYLILIESEEELSKMQVNTLEVCGHALEILHISNHRYLILTEKLTEQYLNQLHAGMEKLQCHYHFVISDEFKNLSEYRQEYEHILSVSKKYLCLKNGITIYPKDYMLEADVFEESLLDRYELKDLLSKLKEHYTILPPSFRYAFIKKYSYLSNAIIDRILQADIHELSAIIAQMDKRPSDMNVIGSVKEFIYKNYMQNISIEDIANAVYLSPSYLCTLFKKETNTTLIAYLTQFRIDKAKELLKKTHIKNVEIANMVGYDSPSYFNMIFKKFTGVTPSEYRKGNFR